MLAYCVHILARIRPLSLKLFRGPLYFACFIIIFHLLHITTKKQARVRRAPVLFTSIILFAIFTQVSTSFFCITYYILLFLRYFCSVVLFSFSIIWISYIFASFYLSFIFPLFRFFIFFSFIFRIVVLLAFASIFSIFKLFHFLCLLRYLISVQQQLIVFVYHHVLYIQLYIYILCLFYHFIFYFVLLHILYSPVCIYQDDRFLRKKIYLYTKA